MTVPADLLKHALSPEITGRAELVDELLRSLDEADRAMDALWAQEAEDRIDACDSGKAKSVSVHEVMKKHEGDFKCNGKI